jgi:tRNA A37 threonylcarbamoyltransferase TsaD
MTEKKLITESHNEFLRETFRAFLAETGEPGLAAAMTATHVQHLHAIETQRLVTCVAHIEGHLRAIAQLTDPVLLGDLLTLLRAGEAKRAESKEERAKETAISALTGRSWEGKE